MSWIKNMIVGRSPAYTRHYRHIHHLLYHLTWKKLINLIKVEWSLRTGKTFLKCYPYVITVDPLNVCNLRCPLCPAGTQEIDRVSKTMTMEDFKSIVDQVKDYAIEMVLHNWGEPLLAPHIFDMIRYAKGNGIGAMFATNFNGVTDEMIEEIIDSGLDHMTFSVDGASQETYEKYRVGGVYEDCIEALRKLQQRKKEKGSLTPIVEWQMVVFQHNEHEVEAARAKAKELGVEVFRPTPVGMPYEELRNVKLADTYTPKDPKWRGYHPEHVQGNGYLYNEPCFYLYRNIVLNPDGGVAPCCAVYHEDTDFGNFLKSSIKDIWNNKKYQSARALFSSKFSSKPIQKPAPSVCVVCPLYKQTDTNRQKKLVKAANRTMNVETYHEKSKEGQQLRVAKNSHTKGDDYYMEVKRKSKSKVTTNI
jgi:radical SAM protein with 4Fe4S-binding SPASM domain